MLRVSLLFAILVIFPLQARASCVDSVLYALRGARASTEDFDPERFAKAKSEYLQRIGAGEGISALPKEPLEKVALFDALRESSYGDRDLGKALNEASPRQRAMLIWKLEKFDPEEKLTEMKAKELLAELSEFVYGPTVKYRDLHLGLRDRSWWGEAEQRILRKKLDVDLRSRPILDVFRSQGMIRDPKRLEKIRHNLVTPGGWIDQTLRGIFWASGAVGSHLVPPIKVEVLRAMKITPELRQKIVDQGFDSCKEDIRAQYGKAARFDLYWEWARKVYAVAIGVYIVKEAAQYVIDLGRGSDPSQSQ